MNPSKVVVRYSNGKVVKGQTSDFLPNKDYFTLEPSDVTAGSKSMQVFVKDLKALFFVKTYTGDPKRKESNQFDPKKPAIGKKIKVVFKDGEELVGTTTVFHPD